MIFSKDKNWDKDLLLSMISFDVLEKFINISFPSDRTQLEIANNNFLLRRELLYQHNQFSD